MAHCCPQSLCCPAGVTSVRRNTEGKAGQRWVVVGHLGQAQQGWAEQCQARFVVRRWWEAGTESEEGPEEESPTGALGGHYPGCADCR